MWILGLKGLKILDAKWLHGTLGAKRSPVVSIANRHD